MARRSRNNKSKKFKPNTIRQAKNINTVQYKNVPSTDAVEIHTVESETPVLIDSPTLQEPQFLQINQEQINEQQNEQDQINEEQDENIELTDVELTDVELDDSNAIKILEFMKSDFILTDSPNIERIEQEEICEEQEIETIETVSVVAEKKRKTPESGFDSDNSRETKKQKNDEEESIQKNYCVIL